MTQIRFGTFLFDASLIAFDKDGTLFKFDEVWRPPFLAGCQTLVSHFRNGPALKTELFQILGYDSAAGRFCGDGPFVFESSAEIRKRVAEAIYSSGAPQMDLPHLEALVDRTMIAALVNHVEDGYAHAATDLNALLASLADAGVACAIVTNDDRTPTEQMLRTLELDSFISFVAAGDDGYAPKPSAESLLATLHALRIPPDQVAVVGDAVTDLQMGRSAGVGLCVGVLTGPAERELLEPFADVILDSIGAIEVA